MKRLRCNAWWRWCWRGAKGNISTPLRQHRAKPAIPFGGKYRIIDFPLMNCLNSGLPHVPVLFN